jgi:hypothetical protein
VSAAIFALTGAVNQHGDDRLAVTVQAGLADGLGVDHPTVLSFAVNPSLPPFFAFIGLFCLESRFLIQISKNGGWTKSLKFCILVSKIISSLTPAL